VKDASFNADTTDNSTLEVHTTGYLKVKDLGVDTQHLADDAVTYAKMQDVAALSVIGNNTNATATPTAIPIDDLKENISNATQTADGLMSSTDKTKLDGIEAGAEVNVQSDWNQTDNTADDFIENKPTIPTNNNELTNGAGYTTNTGTVTQVNSGTGLTGGPITTSGTLSIASGGVNTTQLADGSVSSAKISSTDTLLNANTTQSTIGIGATANSSSSYPKIKMDGGVQIGDQSHTITGTTPELVVSSNTNTVMSVENTGSSDNAVIVIKGPSAILQLNDTDATTGVYNIQSAGDKLRIDRIVGGGVVDSLLTLDSSGNLTISGTLTQNGTP
jgi:hypothetical protein